MTRGEPIPLVKALLARPFQTFDSSRFFKSDIPRSGHFAISSGPSPCTLWIESPVWAFSILGTGFLVLSFQHFRFRIPILSSQRPPDWIPDFKPPASSGPVFSGISVLHGISDSRFGTLGAFPDSARGIRHVPPKSRRPKWSSRNQRGTWNQQQRAGTRTDARAIHRP